MKIKIQKCLLAMTLSFLISMPSLAEGAQCDASLILTRDVLTSEGRTTNIKTSVGSGKIFSVIHDIHTNWNISLETKQIKDETTKTFNGLADGCGGAYTNPHGLSMIDRFDPLLQAYILNVKGKIDSGKCVRKAIIFGGYDRNWAQTTHLDYSIAIWLTLGDSGELKIESVVANRTWVEKDNDILDLVATIVFSPLEAVVNIFEGNKSRFGVKKDVVSEGVNKSIAGTVDNNAIDTSVSNALIDISDKIEEEFGDVTQEILNFQDALTVTNYDIEEVTIAALCSRGNISNEYISVCNKATEKGILNKKVLKNAITTNKNIKVKKVTNKEYLVANGKEISFATGLVNLCILASAYEDTITTHTVEKGETLLLLSEKYYGPKGLYWLIAAFNKIENINLVRIGDKIQIPSLGHVVKHYDVIKPNESLWSRYGKNWLEVYKASGLKIDKDLIHPGTILKNE